MNSRHIFRALMAIAVLVVAHLAFYHYISGRITLATWDYANDADRARDLRLLLQVPMLLDLALVSGLIAYVATRRRDAGDFPGLRVRYAQLRRRLERDREAPDLDTRLGRAFHYAPVAVLLFGGDGHLRLFNPRAAALLRLDDPRRRDLTFTDMLTSGGVVHTEELRAILVERGPQSVHLSLRGATGETIPARAHLAAYDEPGESDANLLVVIDTALGATPPAMPVSGEVVLLADDEQLVRMMLSGMLERLGYTPLAAVDGREALRLFEEHRDRVNAVVLDLAMPGFDGRQVAIRIHEIAPEIPILFCTGYVEPLDLPSGIAKERIVRKPFTFETFRLALEAAIGPRAEDEAES